MRSKGDLGSTLGSGRFLRFQQLLYCIPPSLEAFPDSSGDSSAYCLPLHPLTPRTGPALGSCFHTLWLKPWADSACADCFIYSCFQGPASPTRTQGKVQTADYRLHSPSGDLGRKVPACSSGDSEAGPHWRTKAREPSEQTLTSL